MEIREIKHTIICALESYKELREKEIETKLRIPKNIKENQDEIEQIKEILNLIHNNNLDIKLKN